MLTPILNALRPDDFMLINNKSRAVVSQFTGRKFTQKLTDYPAANAAGQQLLEELDSQTNQARFVLDTKYKTSACPSTEDISQVVTYAEALGCYEAVLVYPATLERPLDERVGRIRVRSLAFALDGDLEEAGQALMIDLLES